jgi:NitT/TauT family transport system substrate-binding protein
MPGYLRSHPAGNGKALLTLLVVALTALALLSTASSASTSQPERLSTNPVTMTVAIDPWIGYGPWYIDKAKGFDTANGVNLKFVNFAEDKEFDSAVVSGRLDSTHALLAQALIYTQKHIPVKVVLFQDISVTADAILANKNIHSVSDLKGKTVGVEKGGGGESLLYKALQKVGLSFKDVKVLNIPAADGPAALVSGRVDADATYEPYISHLQASTHNKFHKIAVAGEFPGLISDLWLTSNKFAQEHPAAVLGALRAWNQGVNYFRTHRSDALSIMAKAAQTDPKTLALSLNGVKLYDAHQSLAFMKTKLVPLLKDTAATQRALGNFKGSVNYKQVFNTSWLQRVQSG